MLIYIDDTEQRLDVSIAIEAVKEIKRTAASLNHISIPGW